MRAISLAVAKDHVECAIHNPLKPGEKLCASCRQAATGEKNVYDSPVKQVTSDSDVESLMDTKELNESITKLGCTPVKLHSVNKKSRVVYAKKKAERVSVAIQKKFAHLIDVPSTSLSSPQEKSECVCCQDLEALMEDLKQKCQTSPRQEVIKILTLAPSSWTVQHTMDEFKVTEYTVKKARALKKSDGVLAEPQKARGKNLPENVVQTVRQFYEEDEFSRMCPGKKECVSVKVPGGQRIHKQKRLLLVNLKELYLEFKARYDFMKVGLSKFCSLRPQWCVTVAARGMHSVCVCETHQNLKLLVNALPTKTDYKEMFGKLVCSVDSRSCMLQRCEKCPGLEELQTDIKELIDKNDVDVDDTYNYKQWVHNGQTKLITVTSTVEEFVETLCNAVNDSTVHHYTAKSQAAYLKKLKETISPDEVIVLLDFAENYSFICQDAVQGFHWDTSQATLHPFTVYHKKTTETVTELECLSVCIVSDCRDHTAPTVHTFISVVIRYLTEILPSLTYVHYFSDGASAQYKNCKNFANLCSHKVDFNIQAEWNFFATSHGKSPCDGIGGTVKRLVARASLQATESRHILTPHDLFTWAKENIHGIKFFYVSETDVQNNAAIIQPRMESAKTVPGTRSHHRFVAVSKDELMIYRLSSDELKTGTKVNVSGSSKISDLNTDDLHPGVYVAVVYDVKWYIGCIDERSNEEEDILVNFMRRNELTNMLVWPSRHDKCCIPFIHVLCTLPAPDLHGQSGRQYKYDSSILKTIADYWEKFKG